MPEVLPVSYDLMGVFAQVQSRLEDNPQISIAKLSWELNVDRHTVGKAVKLAAGVSFRIWQRGLLFHQACALLEEIPDVRIQVISSGLGYSSLAAFRKFVSRNCSLSPTALRVVLRGGGQVLAVGESEYPAAAILPLPVIPHDLRTLLDRIRVTLEDNPQASLMNVSLQLGMDRYLLENAVREAAGTSLGRLRCDLALTQAYALIPSSANRSIKEIAGLLGYSSQRSFARFMVQACAKSPQSPAKTGSIPNCNDKFDIISPTTVQ